MSARIHLFFVTFIAATLYVSWPGRGFAGPSEWQLFAVTVVGIVGLLLSVMAHEWGHWWVARRMGTFRRQVVLGPFGGLADWDVRQPRHSMVIGVAGICVNLGIAGCCLVGLTMMRSDVGLADLLNPLAPYWQGVSGRFWEDVLALVFWVNWLLVLVNLLPARPFDGSVTWPALWNWWSGSEGDWPSVPRVSRLALATAAGLVVMALVLWKFHLDAPYPVSLTLLLLATVVLVGCREGVSGCADSTAPATGRAGVATTSSVSSNGRVERQGDVMAQTPSEWSTHGDSPGLDRSTIDQRPSGGEPTDGEPADEIPAGLGPSAERSLDDILVQLHDSGWEGLSEAQRSFLHRASRTYRRRLGNSSCESS